MIQQPPSPPKKTIVLVAAATASLMLMRWAWRSIGLVSTAILARFLAPTDFGLVAIVFSYMLLLESFTELGIRSALIRHSGADNGFVDTVFTLQVLRGLLIALGVVTSSLVLPTVMHDQRLESVTLCVALVPAITGFCNPAVALYERHLDFRREILLQLASKIVSSTVAVVIAIAFQTYWALVFGAIAQAITRLIVSFLVHPYVPRFGLSKWRELFRFSGWLSATYALNGLAYLDNIWVGGLTSVKAAGLYSVSYQLACMPLGEILPVIVRTLFPALARFKEQHAKLRANAGDALAILAGFCLPIAVGFALVAPEFVSVVYGDKWLSAIVLVQWIAISYGIASLDGGVAHSVALASGRTDLLFRQALTVAAIRIPLFAFGTWVYGLQGAVICDFISSAILALANLHLLGVLLKTDSRSLVAHFSRSIIATLGMALAVVALSEYVGTGEALAVNIRNLGLKVVVGVATYASVRVVIRFMTGQPDALEYRLSQAAAGIYRGVGRMIRR